LGFKLSSAERKSQDVASRYKHVGKKVRRVLSCQHIDANQWGVTINVKLGIVLADSAGAPLFQVLGLKPEPPPFYVR
jgi:hypothetical protein